MALVALLDDFWQEQGRDSASVLVLLDISVTFDTINHGILLEWLHELD